MPCQTLTASSGNGYDTSSARRHMPSFPSESSHRRGRQHLRRMDGWLLFNSHFGGEACYTEVHQFSAAFKVLRCCACFADRMSRCSPQKIRSMQRSGYACPMSVNMFPGIAQHHTLSTAPSVCDVRNWRTPLIPHVEWWYCSWSYTTFLFSTGDSHDRRPLCQVVVVHLASPVRM